MRREWIEISYCSDNLCDPAWSPSMRREWIEIKISAPLYYSISVSLHAEGVD